ncbi:hypothetical protein B0J18DRAFT_440913 [Chaetomium sp. MPI-SDFR-AT-0129]|nr:hypothetical protein B0J18DRAFT_440913 [Chaetomium sp. MPI-SDFR-AT-0129]
MCSALRGSIIIFFIVTTLSPRSSRGFTGAHLATGPRARNLLRCWPWLVGWLVRWFARKPPCPLVPLPSLPPSRRSSATSTAAAPERICHIAISRFTLVPSGRENTWWGFHRPWTLEARAHVHLKLNGSESSLSRVNKPFVPQIDRPHSNAWLGAVSCLVSNTPNNLGDTTTVFLNGDDLFFVSIGGFDIGGKRYHLVSRAWIRRLTDAPEAVAAPFRIQVWWHQCCAAPGTGGVGANDATGFVVCSTSERFSISIGKALA